MASCKKRDGDPMSFSAAPAAQPARYVFRFDGSAGEYFKIWIVNLALTIVTLGIFSAWAKVRTRRYFYGNTFVGGQAFDYHGDPVRILLGRLIALGLLIGYAVTAAFAPMLVFAWWLVFMAGLPWLVKSSLRFNARNTSYRNIRFDFTGTYGGAFKAFILWPILAGITLLSALPLAHRARDYYNINNHYFGSRKFQAEIPAGKLYLIYLLGLLAFVGLGALIGASVYGVYVASHAAPGTPAPGFSAYHILIIFAAVVWIGIVPPIFRTMTFNLAVNNTRLAEDFALESTMSPWMVAWIVMSNLVVTLCTLTLASAWAHVRLARYQAEHMAIAGSGDIETFTATAGPSPSAIGEEVASFFDIDFGL
jgi:uncharacterized membrane protein YjgN (DUF898 family)